MVNKDDTLDHANQRRITPLVRNTFNSTNMMLSRSVMIRQEEGQQPVVLQPGVNSMSIDYNMDQRSGSPCTRGTCDQIIWDQSKNMSTLEILDFVLELLDDHEYNYEDQQHVLDDREDK